jgi:hypothetical protein
LLVQITAARWANLPLVLFLGGHPIKLGLSRYLVDLIERRIVTHLATNGSGLIHDFELAAFGGTSENVARWIQAGQFGLWRETGRLNDIIAEGARRGEGLGEAIGRTIEEEQLPHRHLSIAAAGYRAGVPVTCHVTIGADIIHAHPNCDGAALGATSYRDFLLFANSILGLAHEPEPSSSAEVGTANGTAGDAQDYFADRPSDFGVPRSSLTIRPPSDRMPALDGSLTLRVGLLFGPRL